MAFELGSIAGGLDLSFPYYGLESASYRASKAALNMIMAITAVKYKDEGFKVNVCCPGLNATGLSWRMGDHPRASALNACRLATDRKEEEKGTFTNKDEPLAWRDL